MQTNPSQAYVETQANTAIMDASPHRLIELLFDGAQDKLSVAKGAAERGDRKMRAEAIAKVMEIVSELQGVLNMEAGGEIAERLEALYTYINTSLAAANLTGSVEKLNEASTLLSEVQEGWTGIRNHREP
jgi:flagellar protein FliS